MRVTPQVTRNARNQTVFAWVAGNMVKALGFCHGNERSHHWDGLVALHTLSVLIQALRWQRQQSLGDIGSTGIQASASYGGRSFLRNPYTASFEHQKAQGLGMAMQATVDDLCFSALDCRCPPRSGLLESSEEPLAPAARSVVILHRQ